MEHVSLATRGMRFDAFAAGPPDGDLVLLLHGFPQQPTCWEHPLRELATAGYRAVAPAQRGYSAGARPGRTRDYRLGELVDDVIALVGALGAERAHLVGHDFGAAVGWHLAAWHPDRVRSFVSLSTPHPTAYVRAALTTTQALRSLYIPFFWTPFVPDLLLGARRATLLRVMLERSGLTAALARAYAQAMTEPGALTAALRWYRAMRPWALRDAEPVGVPVLHIWGARDGAIGPQGPRATARYVTGPYQFEQWPQAGHWLPELHASDVSAAVLRFLAAHAG